MRGIILKDLYEGFCIRKNTLNWAISMIFISFLTGINSMMRGPYGFLLIVVLLFPIMGSKLLQMTVEQDEKSEFDRIQLTYPLSKREIVLSKYLGGLLVQGGMILYSFLFLLVYVYGYKTLTFGEAISTWGIGVAGSLVYFSVSYMVYFWLGNMKGVIFTFITMAVLVIGFVFSVFNVGLEELMQVDKSIWVLCLWGMAAVFIALSYWISVKIYAKKHS